MSSRVLGRGALCRQVLPVQCVSLQLRAVALIHKAGTKTKLLSLSQSLDFPPGGKAAGHL